jgi:hypothetical protein
MAQNESCPCCTENHRNFDFWVGEWEVYDTTGNLVGTNTIDKIQDGCLLRENWIGSGGNTGTSMNFFNLKSRQWEQIWVDNSGTHLYLKGNRIGNQMVLSSDEFTHTDGRQYINRITWTLNDNGTVRQFWEVLQNDKVVNVAFDGLYKRTH